MRPLIWLALIFACGIGEAGWSRSPTDTAARPFTFDEMAKLEDIGPGAFTPDGSSLIFVRRPRFSDLPDYSLAPFGPFFGELMTANARSGDAKPLFRKSKGALYALISRSPDGRYVAYFRACRGELRLGVFDRRTGRERILNDAPAQDYYHELTPIWLGTHELAFSAQEPGQLAAYMPYFRRATGEALHKAWQATWVGRTASYGLYRSRPSNENAPFRGILLRIDVSTGKSHKIADGLYSDLRVSRDGKYLSGLRQYEKDQLGTDVTSTAWTYGRAHLALFNLHSGKSVQAVPSLDIVPGTMEWSPHDDRIGFFAWPNGGAAGQGRFYSFDLALHQLREFSHRGLDLVNEREFGPPGRPMRFLWLGRDIAVAARQNPGGDQTPRFTQRGVTGRDLNADPGRFDWYLLGDGGSIRNLTSTYKTVSPWVAGETRSGAYLILDREVMRMAADGTASRIAPGRRVAAYPEASGPAVQGRQPFGSTAIFRSADANQHQLLAFDLARGAERDLSFPPGLVTLMAFGPASGSVAFKKILPNGTDVAIQAGEQAARVVFRINKFLAGVGKPLSWAISYAGRSGEALTSCLTLPANYQAGHRYPTIVYVYPESTPSCSAEPLLQQPIGYENHNILLAHGYAFLSVANPGIATREGGPLGGIVEATDRAIDAAVAEGLVDPERLGLIGASGAGYSGLWLAGHSNRFKAIVSINGIADAHTHYYSHGIDQLFYSELVPWNGQAQRYEGRDQFTLQASPWESPEIYWKASPVAYADKIDAAVLLVSTDMDSGGISEQYDEMFVALHRLRKTVDYVKYWGEWHGPSSFANVRDLTQRTVAWFDKYVAPARAGGPLGRGRASGSEWAPSTATRP